MNIRTFQPGDEATQVSIYNEAAAALPRFKPAALDEVRRRCRAADFNAASRFYAEVAGQVVGYATFADSGRINYPWCRKGQEACLAPLFQRTIEAMRQRGLKHAFAAYRGDWTAQRDFFLANGFAQMREMNNYAVDLIEMPTPAARTTSNITALTPADLPAVIEMGRGVLRVSDPAALEQILFRNPYFSADWLFALRGKGDNRPLAVALVIANSGYANPKQLDANMPCFRLGAFGTEGLTHKRINGVFSFLAANERDLHVCGLDLLTFFTGRIQDTDIETFAAQVCSDATVLDRFYKSVFRRQGSFPLYERDI